MFSNDGIAVVSDDFTYGRVSGKADEPPDFLGRDIDFDLYWKAWQIIQDKFVGRPAGETRLLYGSIAGMVASLGDPFSVFLEPSITAGLTEELTGQIEGIGAEIGIRDNALVVISPLPGSPAEKAGIREGDRIWEIDQAPSAAMTLEEAVHIIRGPKGTPVTLTVSRQESAERLSVTIIRDTVRIVSVEWDILDTAKLGVSADKKIGYIRITHFNADTGERMKRAIQDAIIAHPDGIILDVRNNPGGYLDQAIEVSGYWVPSGEVVVMEEEAGQAIQKHRSRGKGELGSIPTVVLINGGTASGSEILAGALRDNGLATIVGQTSFGKGSVQSIEYLPDGSSIKLTVARWLTPIGSHIDQVGVVPDVEIPQPDEDAVGTDSVLSAAGVILSGIIDAQHI